LNDYQLKKFLRIKTSQWGRIIAKRDDIRSRFVDKIPVGTGHWFAACQWWEVPQVLFNMRRCRINSHNPPGLEALIIHEICHIINHDDDLAPHDGRFYQLEDKYLKLAGLEDEEDTLKNIKQSVCR
jgi:hypothetical protein